MSTDTTPMGRFITFEGIDGAGKSTHIHRLAERLRATGQRVTVTREPGGTPLAEKLRALLLHDPMDPLCEALLMFAARRDHLQQVIEPALSRGETVLCDRFTDATFAYQGYGRGFNLQTLATLESWVQAPQPGAAVRQPDLTLWFNVSPSVAAQRLAGARDPDKFEALPVDFFARVAHGYSARAQADPTRFATLNGEAQPEQVWDQLVVACQGHGVLA